MCRGVDPSALRMCLNIRVGASLLARIDEPLLDQGGSSQACSSLNLVDRNTRQREYMQGMNEDSCALVRTSDANQTRLVGQPFSRNDGRIMLALKMLWPAKITRAKRSIAEVEGLRNNDYVTCKPCSPPMQLSARCNFHEVCVPLLIQCAGCERIFST